MRRYSVGVVLAAAASFHPAQAGVIVDQFSFSGHAVIYNPVTPQETISPYTNRLWR